MIDVDQVLAFVRREGPLLPGRVAKEFGMNMLLASAVLSQLVTEKKVKVTSVKVGGSPLYYTDEKRESIQQYWKNLNEKDQRAYNLIREQRVVRDTVPEPLMRVALRAIKDFAVPLTVKSEQGEELFWKWYLLSDDEASHLIDGFMNPKVERAEKPVEKTKSSPEPLHQLQVVTPEKSPIEKSPIESEKTPVGPPPQVVPQASIPEQRKLPKTMQESVEDAWLDEVRSFLGKQGARCTFPRVLRKGKEIEMLVDVPTPLGGSRYFCRAVKKQRIGESDIVQALYAAQDKKLPVLFITTGQLTKKIQEDRDQKYPGMLFVTMG